MLSNRERDSGNAADATLPRTGATSHSFLMGGGRMGERLHAHDWSTSPLGDPACWPAMLRINVGLVLSTATPMFVAWGPDKAMVYNDGYAEILGDNHPGAIGMPFSEVWKESLSGEALLMARGYTGEPEHRENMEFMLRRHGYWESATFSFYYAPIRDETGAVGGVLCTCTETTPMARSDREQFRFLVSAISDHAIYMLDREGVVISWNAGAERAMGYHSEEILGRSFACFFTGKDQAAGRPAASLAMAQASGRFENEAWRIRKDGSRFWASTVMEPLLDDAGRQIGFAKAMRDITEERATKGDRDQLATLGALASTLVSEINQPLTAMTSYLTGCDAILERMPDEDQRLLRLGIGEASQQALRVGNMMRDMRAFIARADNARSAEDLSSLIEESCALMLAGARHRGVEASFDFDPGVVLVKIDRAQIQSVLFNLIRNALEAIKTSTCKQVRIATRRLQSLDQVQISIVDSGTGIPPDIAARLFHPFVTTKQEGMGLGLSLCRTIVEAHGGKIWAEPGAISGTLIHFTLRINKA